MLINHMVEITNIVANIEAMLIERRETSFLPKYLSKKSDI